MGLMMQTGDNDKRHDDDPERGVRECQECHKLTPLPAEYCSSCGKAFAPPTDTAGTFAPPTDTAGIE